MRDNYNHEARSHRRSNTASRADGGRPPSTDAGPPGERGGEERPPDRQPQQDRPPQQWHQAPPMGGGAGQSERPSGQGSETPPGTRHEGGSMPSRGGQHRPQSQQSGRGNPSSHGQRRGQHQQGQQHSGQNQQGQQGQQYQGQQGQQHQQGQQPTQRGQHGGRHEQPQGQQMHGQPQGQQKRGQPQGQQMHGQPQGQFGQHQSQGQFSQGSQTGSPTRSSRQELQQQRGGFQQQQHGGRQLAPAKAERIVQTDVVTADRDTPVKTVVAAMAEYDVGSVVVVEDEKPVGIVTDRQVAMTLEHEQDLSDATAEDMLSDDLVTGTNDMTVFEALDRLSDENVRRLPIVDDDGSLYGIVTLDDLLVVLGEELGKAASIIEAQSPRI